MRTVSDLYGDEDDRNRRRASGMKGGDTAACCS